MRWNHGVFICFFDGKDEYGNFGLNNFAVRALDEENIEIMYVLSSLSTAKYMTEGKSAEWLMNSIFHENTGENRLAAAKTMISRIELGLRQTIILRLKRGNALNWWDLIDEKIRKITLKVYKSKFGNQNPSPDQLMDYTYLPNLRQIINDNWSVFSDIFPSQQEFGNDMERLNYIRREESHNRQITDKLIEELKVLYDKLAGRIENFIPGIIPEFLTENWRTVLKNIIDEFCRNHVDVADSDRKNQEVIFRKFRIYSNQFDDLERKLISITAPPHKKELHEKLLGIVSGLKKSVKGMKSSAEVKNYKDFYDYNDSRQVYLDEINEFRKEYLLSEL